MSSWKLAPSMSIVMAGSTVQPRSHYPFRHGSYPMGRFCGVTQKNHYQSGLFPQESCTTGSEGEYTDRMLDDTQQQSIVTRLNRVEGQIRGIRRMVQEPRLCVEILQQLSAAEAALNRISLAVFKFHVERCVPDGVVLGEPEKTRRLTELVDIFDRFAK